MKLRALFSFRFIFYLNSPFTFPFHLIPPSPKIFSPRWAKAMIESAFVPFSCQNCMYSCFVQFSAEKVTTTYLDPMGMRFIASKTTMERIEK